MMDGGEVVLKQARRKMKEKNTKEKSKQIPINDSNYCFFSFCVFVFCVVLRLILQRYF